MFSVGGGDTPYSPPSLADTLDRPFSPLEASEGGENTLRRGMDRPPPPALLSLLYLEEASHNPLQQLQA